MDADFQKNAGEPCVTPSDSDRELDDLAFLGNTGAFILA